MPISPAEWDEVAYLALRLDPNDISCSDFQDPGYFTHETDGSIVLSGSGGEVLAEIGRFRVIQVDAESAVSEGVSVYQVFDCQAVTWAYFEALYDRNFEVSSHVLRLLDCDGQSMSASLLILDRIEIKPAYRGNEYGLEALRCMIQRFRMGAGLIVMKPFPLQYEAAASDLTPGELAERGLTGFPMSARVATAKLRKYYARLGFQRIPRTPFMALPTCWPMPVAGIPEDR